MQKPLLLLIITTHFCALSLYSSLSVAASAGDKYFGVEYVSTSFESNTSPKTVNPALISAKYGHYLIDRVSLEGRFGFGFGFSLDDSKYSTNILSAFRVIDGTDVKTIDRRIYTVFDRTLSNMLGIYGAVDIWSNDETSLYGILGYTSIESRLDTVVETTEKERDAPAEERKPLIDYYVSSERIRSESYGVGINFGKFNIEYMQYLDKDGVDISALSFGFLTRF